MAVLDNCLSHDRPPPSRRIHFRVKIKRLDRTGGSLATPNLQPSTHPQAFGRSAVALFAGLLVGLLLSIGTDILMSALGVLPPLGQPASSNALLLATVYRSVYGIVGSYTAARLAPNRPMHHALALGALGLVVSIVGAVVTWNRQPSLGPHWYPVALIVLAIPTAWAGGRLRVGQLTKNRLYTR